MPKRNILLAVFGILVLLSVITFLPVANGYNYIYIDAEDDVYQYCDSTDETDIGDYHDEIDIVKLNITGKYASFTVAGDLGDWDPHHHAVIIFSSHFTYNGPHEGLSWRSPFYLIDYESPSFASLERAYSLGGDGYVYEVWNGTAWENETTATPANILNESSQHSIIAYIPDAVEEIPSDMKCILNTEVIPWFIPSDCWYEDIAPALPTAGGGGNIPGYNLFILFCVMIGITILLIRKRNKLK
ncbi:MAG: hypothetical protein ACFFAQ_08320 [Promethearchaeota archaeon]